MGPNRIFETSDNLVRKVQNWDQIFENQVTVFTTGIWKASKWRERSAFDSFFNYIPVMHNTMHRDRKMIHLLITNHDSLNPFNSFILQTTVMP